MEENQKKMSRKHEREFALRCIFQMPFHAEGRDVERCIERHFEVEAANQTEDSITGTTTGFAEALIKATLDNRDHIDELIQHYMRDDWNLDRLPNAEKAVLRMCAAEMLYLKTPKEIAINEAIDLVKRYGEDDGSTYVNGILNNLAKENIVAEENKE